MSTKDNYIDTRAQSAFELSRERLQSCKQIAVYLDREVRTVQRWEKCEGLPVRRQFHVKGGTVWAFKHDIDAWFRNRCHPSSEAVPQVRRSTQSVDWSSPTKLVTRCTKNSCWLWLLLGLAEIVDSTALAQTYIFGRANFATGAAPVVVLTGDFNGDGKLDLAVINRADSTVSVLLGKPDGTFAPKVDYAVSNSPQSGTVGDFNNEGKLDFAVVASV